MERKNEITELDAAVCRALNLPLQSVTDTLLKQSYPGPFWRFACKRICAFLLPQALLIVLLATLAIGFSIDVWAPLIVTGLLLFVFLLVAVPLSIALGGVWRVDSLLAALFWGGILFVRSQKQYAAGNDKAFKRAYFRCLRRFPRGRKRANALLRDLASAQCLRTESEIFAGALVGCESCSVPIADFFEDPDHILLTHRACGDHEDFCVAVRAINGAYYEECYRLQNGRWIPYLRAQEGRREVAVCTEMDIDCPRLR